MPLSAGTALKVDHAERAQWKFTAITSTFHSSLTGQQRSGNCLYHDNTFDGVRSNDNCVLHIPLFRALGAGGIHGGVFGSADGTSPWDRNDTEGNGTYVEGHPPYLFASGTATTNSTGGTLKDSTANWAPNQWVGFSVTNKNPAAPPYLKGSVITANTRTQISYHLLFCYRSWASTGV